MKAINILILLLLLVIYSFSQNTPIGYEAELNLKNLAGSGGGPVRTFDTRYEGVKGSPLLFDKCRKGRVTLIGDTSGQKVMINYDVFNDALLYADKTGQMMVISKEYVDKFEIESDKENIFWKFIKYDMEPSKEKEKIKYVKELYKGKCFLFMIMQKQLLKADFTGAYSSGRRYDEFYSEDAVMFQKPNGEILKLKPKNKAVIKLLSDKQTEIEKYIKELKIDVSKEEDLIKIFKYYDSLI
jgi:hypothetical protein